MKFKRKIQIQIILPESTIVVIYVVVLDVEPPPRDLQDGGDPDLADPHLVDDLQLHSGPKDGSDALPDFAVEVGRQSSRAGQTFDQKIFPVGVLRLNRWNKQSRQRVTS